MTTTTEAPARVRYRTLAGNLTRTPELRFSSKGTPWATCGLAVTPRVRGDDDAWGDGETVFCDLVCFGDLAENVADLTKGTRVIAYGKLEAETWTGKDGTERTTEKLVADEIGASLRFATVEVHRSTRQGAGETPTGGAGDGYDEEPF
ncbi:MAG: single-stranded DNA-binding protein [Actinomycetota bacterium]|jgi:single-strand DNA-binding protein|nr:single-stranded DNA-binding protein [Actinomycetota bacterium]MDA8358958.1 single-stranded DNA-binding protein [Actinomycetota bacterium]